MASWLTCHCPSSKFLSQCKHVHSLFLTNISHCTKWAFFVQLQKKLWTRMCLLVQDRTRSDNLLQIDDCCHPSICLIVCRYNRSSEIDCRKLAAFLGEGFVVMSLQPFCDTWVELTKGYNHWYGYSTGFRVVPCYWVKTDLQNLDLWSAVKIMSKVVLSLSDDCFAGCDFASLTLYTRSSWGAHNNISLPKDPWVPVFGTITQVTFSRIWGHVKIF